MSDLCRVSDNVAPILVPQEQLATLSADMNTVAADLQDQREQRDRICAFIRAVDAHLEKLRIQYCYLEASDGLRGEQTLHFVVDDTAGKSCCVAAIWDPLRDDGFWMVQVVRRATLANLTFCYRSANSVMFFTVVLHWGGRRLPGGIEAILSRRVRRDGVWVEGRTENDDETAGRSENTHKRSITRCTALCHDVLSSASERTLNSILTVLDWLSPRGLFVVFLGPDGVGKTTVKNRLREIFKPVFPEYKTWHYRPRCLGARGPGRPLGQPHSMPPRSKIASIAYLVTVFLDCWVGYFAWARPILAAGGMVVFDRYLHDIVIDPVRYRYSGPKWVCSVLQQLVPPRRALFIVFEGDVNAIYHRKQELPVEILRAQRDAYIEWAQERSNCLVVNADAGLNETVSKTANQLVAFLAANERRRSV